MSMWKPLIAVTAATLVLTGCAGTPDTSVEKPAAAPFVNQPDNGSDPTQAGEVCDPGNANDALCAAFYPHLAAQNMFDRQPEPVASMSDAERIELATKACAEMESGEAPGSSTLVESPEFDARHGAGAANELLYTVAGYGYCQDELAQIDPSGAWIIEHYAELGMESAKAEFADGTMPELPDHLVPALPEGVSADSVS